jgi:hypothetical protein
MTIEEFIEIDMQSYTVNMLLEIIAISSFDPNDYFTLLDKYYSKFQNEDCVNYLKHFISDFDKRTPCYLFTNKWIKNKR